jgi:hypothetical protein
VIDESPAAPSRLLLLGREHDEYGRVDYADIEGRTAAAISVGSDPTTWATRWKFDPDVLNEDALCAIEGDGWAGLAVADAHYGPEASHLLLARLDGIWSKIRPTDVEHLGQMIEFLRHGDPQRTESETTLLVAYYNRAERRGYGISFGDSSFVVLGPGRVPRTVNERDIRFVNAVDRGSLRNGLPFWFEAEPGDLLLAFTDGVNECHYREPATSVNLDDIAAAVASASFDPLQSVTNIALLALEGVRGNPGGQDNLAIIASQA